MNNDPGAPEKKVRKNIYTTTRPAQGSEATAEGWGMPCSEREEGGALILFYF